MFLWESHSILAFIWFGSCNFECLVPSQFGSLNPKPFPTPKPSTPYARWNSSSGLNYGELERHLFPSAPAADDEDEEGDTEELEDEDEDENEDEEEDEEKDEDYEWSCGALASLFSLFGVSMPKGEK